MDEKILNDCETIVNQILREKNIINVYGLKESSL